MSSNLSDLPHHLDMFWHWPGAMRGGPSFVYGTYGARDSGSKLRPRPEPVRVLSNDLSEVIVIDSRFNLDCNRLLPGPTTTFQYRTREFHPGRGVLESMFPELGEASNEAIDTAVRYARGKSD